MPKVQNIPSATSTSTAKCSTTSSLSHEASSDVRRRGPFRDPTPGHWFSSEPVMQTAMQTAVAPSTQAQASVGGPSNTLTGYCDTVIGANPPTLMWRDHARPTDIPNPEYSRQNERDSSQPRILNGPDTSLGFRDTVLRDSQSQRSTATYFAPRKPLEQSCGRSSLHIPRNFSDAKASGALEFHKAYPRLTDILAIDYSSISQPSQQSGYFSSPRTAHSYQPTSLQQHNTPTMDGDPTSLDPISALLRAGDIFSSQERLAHPQYTSRADVPAATARTREGLGADNVATGIAPSQLVAASLDRADQRTAIRFSRLLSESRTSSAEIR